MFYYPIVLHRQSGCFSTIWLAATKGIRVNRRELLSVNVNQTCGDILNYVTAQVPAPQPNLPKPRFSLYLSSQLQYGVVVVYHRQCGFLLEEIQQVISRLLRFKNYVHIDMAEADRRVLDVPDPLCMMEEAEGAQDPFFGLMGSDQLPSPYKVHLAEFVNEEHSLVPSYHSTPEEQGFRSSPAAITLTEREQFVSSAAEPCFEGDDLPEATDRDIDLLLDQPDPFGQGEEERTGEAEGAGSFTDQLKETELGRTPEAPEGAAHLEMTPVHVALPSSPSGVLGKDGPGTSASSSEELAVRPARKPAGGRRRQLVFADPEVQISERAMRGQIENPLTETLKLSEVQLDFQSLTWLTTAAQLFSAPCGSLLHADLLSLWKQQAFITVLHPGGLEEEEEVGGESEQDREILRAERKRKHSEMREISSESGLHPADGSSATNMSLDVSKEDKSVSDVITSTSRWSLLEDVQPMMEPIAEETIEMPEAQTDGEDRETPSLMASLLHTGSGEVSFHSMLPLEADRFTAAHTFSKLLELLSAGQVTARQTEPYGRIAVNLEAAESL
ncbi:REC8 meiotic recombination protein b [Salarias fasciatus]|uniref:REC8 meiotic recombination protein b n=1 Tax=Salarias fasciatus TaxID=181472 RepID=UPI001176ED7A|nr:meiotic recombination protein REC8 homolog [Salarias fasciatus]